VGGGALPGQGGDGKKKGGLELHFRSGGTFGGAKRKPFFPGGAGIWGVRKIGGPERVRFKSAGEVFFRESLFPRQSAHPQKRPRK